MPASRNPNIDGLLLVDKPSDCTSHDVVQRVRRALGQRKIGHCGTLDPSATGLLVLTLGRATRLTRFLIRAPKVYRGTIRFGISTDTYDAAGDVVREAEVPELTEERLTRAMAGFVGEQRQQTPPFSAKKSGGRKFYQMARKGEEVPESHKDITIYSFEILGRPENDRLEFELACTSGTYVRSVAHDLGEQLGCGAHLSTLVRTRVGPFELEDATKLDELPGPEEDSVPVPARGWVRFDDIPLPFSELIADAQQERRLRHGQTVLARELDVEEGDWIKLVDERHRLIAVGTVVERIGSAGVGVIQPRIVFS